MLTETLRVQEGQMKDAYRDTVGTRRANVGCLQRHCGHKKGKCRMLTETLRVQEGQM